MRTRGAGVAGGLLAGALVGAIEALVAWRLHAGGGALPALGWAIVAYGLVGATVGLGIGIVAGALRTGAFGLALGGVAAGLGFVVARFRIVHDVFLERPPQGLVPTLVEAGALVALAAGAIAVARALRDADERRGLATRPGVVAALVAIVGLGWSIAERMVPAERAAPPPSGATAPAGAPNVILVVADALRADHLGCYGSGTVKTPAIDRLAADGTRYAHAFAQASWTRPSFATLFTGLYPSSHGAVRKADVLPEGVETLAEVLAKGGYYTAGFPNDVNVAPAFGFGQGFAEYRYLAPDRFFWANDAAAELTLYGGLRLVRERFLARGVDVDAYYRPAEEVVATARGWLDGAAASHQPFFLYLHFMDPHDPYMVHPFDGVGYARVAMPNPSPAMAETLHRAYEGEVAYLDEHLGVLFQDLARRGLYDSSLIVFTADHGEEFHEHGGWWHGATLYDEQIAVPLIVKPPKGGAAGRVVDELTASLDVAPTVLRAVGLAAPAAMQGQVLPLDGAPAARESVFAEEDFDGNVLSSVRTRTWKLVKANEGNPRGLPPLGLFDLGADPTETKNLADADPVKREELRAALGRGTLAAREHEGSSATTDVDAATKARLEALGYLKKD